MNNTETLIVRDDARLSITFTEQAVALREAALEKAALVGKVSNADEQQAAVDAQVEIARVLKLVETARKTTKAPVLDFGAQIDRAAREFVEADLKPEANRLAQLIGDFQAVEAARVRAAEAAKRLEEERIAREAREAEQQALRLKAEADARIAAAKNEAERIELQRLAAIQEAQTHADLDRIEAERAAQVKALDQEAIAPAKAAGQAVRSDWEVEVYDVHALYRSHPNCVKLEPLVGEIKSLLNAGVDVKGVRGKRVLKSEVRLGRSLDLVPA